MNKLRHFERFSAAEWWWHKSSGPFRTLLLAVILSVWISGACIGSDQDASPAALESAARYHQGDLEGAIRVLETAIAANPSDPQLHFMLGNALFRQKRFAESIQSYNKATQLRENHPDTFLNLGFACYHNKQFDEAVAAWEEALKRSPRDPLMLVSLALGKESQGNTREAEGYVAAATALESEWRERIVIDVRWNEEMLRSITELTGAGANRDELNNKSNLHEN